MTTKQDRPKTGDKIRVKRGAIMSFPYVYKDSQIAKRAFQTTVQYVNTVQNTTFVCWIDGNGNVKNAPIDSVEIVKRYDH